ncbi:MAG: hemolysin III family protein [Pseudomonadota bacterium]
MKSATRAYSRAERLADTTIHIVGVLSALIAVPIMVTLAAVWRDDGWLVAAVAVYGISLVLMLAASAGYNMANLRLEGGRVLDWLRRLDHGAIYMKIAGTYTPYAVLAGGATGRWLLAGIWTGATVGMLAKLLAPEKWERLSLVLYLALGWCFVLVAGPVSAAITTATLVLIVVGGCLYTLGIVFHLWERLPFQNAIWHLFVLAASFVFYSAMVIEITIGA